MTMHTILMTILNTCVITSMLLAMAFGALLAFYKHEKKKNKNNKRGMKK